MPASFSITPTDLLIWALIGLVGGVLGGMVARSGAMRPSDALLGVVGALLGGVAVEFAGMRESGEAVAGPAAAFFGALIVTVLVRLIPGRFAA